MLLFFTVGHFTIFFRRSGGDPPELYRSHRLVCEAPALSMTGEQGLRPQVILVAVASVGAVCACSVVSSSLRPCGLYPAKLPCPRILHGMNTGVGCHFLLQGIFLESGLLGLLHWQADSLSLSHLGRSRVDGFLSVSDTLFLWAFHHPHHPLHGAAWIPWGKWIPARARCRKKQSPPEGTATLIRFVPPGQMAPPLSQQRKVIALRFRFSFGSGVTLCGQITVVAVCYVIESICVLLVYCS